MEHPAPTPTPPGSHDGDPREGSGVGAGALGQLRLFAALAGPAHGPARVLDRGRWPAATLAVALACGIAALNVSRLSASASVGSLVYGPNRSPIVPLLLDTIGTSRTAVLVYALERTWPWLLVLSALAPLLVWLLGASAVHAAARMADARERFGRFFVFFGYATAIALVPSGLATYVLEGDPRSAAAGIGRLIGLLLLVWLAVLTYRGVRAHYRVAPGRARMILVLAVGLFYLVPLALIVIAVVAIVGAAIFLDLA